MKTTKRIRSVMTALAAAALLCSCAGNASEPVQTAATFTGVYENNPYFDIVDTAVLHGTDNSGSEPVTYVIHKLYARESIDIDTTLTAYAENGEKIGESREYTLPLVKDAYSFLVFPFQTDEPIAETKGSFSGFQMLERGPERSVEMIQWAIDENGLKAAVEQTAKQIGPLTRGRFLLTKENRIIGYAKSWFMKEYVQKQGDIAEICADDWCEYFCEQDMRPDNVELFLNP